MLTAINSIKLILLIVLGCLFLIGQGWLIVGPFFHGSLFSKKRAIPNFVEISFLIICGLIINYGIVLIVQTLKISIIVSCVLAVIGIGCYLVALKKAIKRSNFTSNFFIKIFGIVLASSLFIGPIIIQPLNDWDARSIWFLHAKMIYSAGAFSQTIGWLHPSINFSHIDYPNLVPTLAAQISYLFGFWNEYLPKLSLFFLLLPAIILLFTFYKRSFSFLLLIVLIPFSFASRLWNGYMDGYLVLYFALSLLLLGRYFKESKPIDLISSTICLILLLYLKNEGELAVISGVIAFFFTWIFKKSKLSIRIFFKENYLLFIGFILLLLPFGIWNLYKYQWGITNDLELGSSHSFLQFINRINDGSYKMIIKSVYKQMHNGIMLIGLLSFTLIAVKKMIPREILPIIVAAGVYCLGIMAIYMITPWDLNWHLLTSVDRTVLTVTACLYAISYYLISNLEKYEEKLPVQPGDISQ